MTRHRRLRNVFLLRAVVEQKWQYLIEYVIRNDGIRFVTGFDQRKRSVPLNPRYLV